MCRHKNGTPYLRGRHKMNRSILYCECKQVDDKTRCHASIPNLQREEDNLYDSVHGKCEQRLVIVEGCVFLHALLEKSDLDYLRVGRAYMFLPHDIKHAIAEYDDDLEEQYFNVRTPPTELVCECGLDSCHESITPTTKEWAVYRSIVARNDTTSEEWYIIEDGCRGHSHIEANDIRARVGRMTFVDYEARAEIFEKADDEIEEDSEPNIECQCGLFSCRVNPVSTSDPDVCNLITRLEPHHQSTINTDCPLYPLITSGIVMRADNWVIVEDGDLADAQGRYNILEGLK